MNEKGATGFVHWGLPLRRGTRTDCKPGTDTRFTLRKGKKQ